MAIIERATAEANWYALSVDDVVARVGVDADRGLDPDGVQRRLAEFGRNEILACVAGLFTAFRMMRLPDPEPSGSVEGDGAGVTPLTGRRSRPTSGWSA